MNKLQDFRPDPSSGVLAETKSLAVVDRRPIIGECLCLWLYSLGPEFHPVSMTTIQDAQRNGVLSRAAAVIFCTGAMAPCDDLWLQEQVAWTHGSRPDVPLVLIAELPDIRLADSAVRQLHLKGYIATSSSLELATTALQVIIQGGRYVPQERHDIEEPAQLGPDVLQLPHALASASAIRLTPRERSVLDLLEHGLPNKIIGYRLGMSQSTVKAHVHNIIAKLNVRNRTEAAVARFATSIAQTSFAPSVFALNADHERPLGETE